LIDFGFAEKFRNLNGTHIVQEDADFFRGNMIFASMNQFNFKKTSRKDDLVSLCYMLVYFFKQGNVEFICKDSSLS
jgi:hypothetical protein